MLALKELLSSGWRIAVSVLVVFGLVVALMHLASPQPTPAATSAGAAPAIAPAPPAEFLVFVSGAVAQPGLYRLAAGARVADAIADAGGITSAADPGRLPNLAARLHDGHQINVPLMRGGGSRAAPARLDLNTAGLDELTAIPGMPAGLPEAIVAHRDQWGSFSSVSELATILGVDRATATALGHFLTARPGP